ncbi:MAG: PEGA domain-containing protein [Kiritimatiellae bacterium]|nr:PEGA domain-containing protein [Kiritimatiellia bacterium]
MKRIFACAAAAAAFLPCIAAAQPAGASAPGLAPVILSATVDGASVTVDGVPRGKTPVQTALAAGHHVARLEAPGAAPAFFDFETGGEPSEKFFALPEPAVAVLVQSDPPGASVSLDGIHAGTTPLLLPAVAPGRHGFLFEKPGFKDQLREMVLAQPGPVKIEAAMESSTAVLAVFSEPSGATVFVSGVDRGKTPVEVPGIPETGVAVDIALDGYSTWRAVTGPVAAGTVFRIDATLESLPAVVRVESIPDGARIYIDNSFAGVSPFVSTNSAGLHRMRADLEGHASVARSVVLRPGDNPAQEFRLRQTGANASFSTSPADVDVIVDGVPRGRTTGDGGDSVSGVFVVSNLAPGEHSVVFSRPGWESKTVSFTVQEGKTTVVDTTELTRLFIPDFQIETRSTGTVKGVFIENAADRYRLEVAPGVVRSIPKSEILRVSIIRHDREDGDPQ